MTQKLKVGDVVPQTVIDRDGNETKVQSRVVAVGGKPIKKDAVKAIQPPAPAEK